MKHHSPLDSDLGARSALLSSSSSSLRSHTSSTSSDTAHVIPGLIREEVAFRGVPLSYDDDKFYLTLWRTFRDPVMEKQFCDFLYGKRFSLRINIVQVCAILAQLIFSLLDAIETTDGWLWTLTALAVAAALCVSGIMQNACFAQGTHRAICIELCFILQTIFICTRYSIRYGAQDVGKYNMASSAVLGVDIAAIVAYRPRAWSVLVVVVINMGVFCLVQSLLHPLFLLQETKFYFLLAYCVGEILVFLLMLSLTNSSRRMFWQTHLVEKNKLKLVEKYAKVKRFLENILPSFFVSVILEEDDVVTDAVSTISMKSLASNMRARNCYVYDMPRGSVILSDLVGFTRFAGCRHSKDVIEVLNTIYFSFDCIASQLKLNTAKTIGDAYLAVGGMELLPQCDPHQETPRNSLRGHPSADSLTPGATYVDLQQMSSDSCSEEEGGGGGMGFVDTATLLGRKRDFHCLLCDAMMFSIGMIRCLQILNQHYADQQSLSEVGVPKRGGGGGRRRKRSLFPSDEEPMLQLRVGLFTGRVVLAVLGTVETTLSFEAIGECLHVVKALEQSSRPGHVHVEEATRSLLQSDFVFEESPFAGDRLTEAEQVLRQATYLCRGEGGESCVENRQFSDNLEKCESDCLFQLRQGTSSLRSSSRRSALMSPASLRMNTSSFLQGADAVECCCVRPNARLAEFPKEEGEEGKEEEECCCVGCLRRTGKQVADVVCIQPGVELANFKSRMDDGVVSLHYVGQVTGLVTLLMLGLYFGFEKDWAALQGASEFMIAVYVSLAIHVVGLFVLVLIDVLFKLVVRKKDGEVEGERDHRSASSSQQLREGLSSSHRIRLMKVIFGIAVSVIELCCVASVFASFVVLIACCPPLVNPMYELTFVYTLMNAGAKDFHKYPRLCILILVLVCCLVKEIVHSDDLEQSVADFGFSALVMSLSYAGAVWRTLSNDRHYELRRECFAAQARIESEQANARRLLLSVVPERVLELAMQGKSLCETYDAVAVFSEMDGFAGLVETDLMSAAQMLASVYVRFDTLLSQNRRCMKIKSVEDMYLFVALPDQIRDDDDDDDDDHAVTAGTVGRVLEQPLFATRTFYHVVSTIERCQGAFEIEKEGVRGQTQGDISTLQLRFGASRGVLSGGILGRGKIVYDIIGDAVNVASRLTTSGQPGVVHVLADQVDLFRRPEDPESESQGMTFLKGKGKIATAFLRLRQQPQPQLRSSW